MTVSGGLVVWWFGRLVVWSFGRFGIRLSIPAMSAIPAINRPHNRITA